MNIMKFLFPKRYSDRRQTGGRGLVRLPSRERLRAFAHTPLWRGVLPAFALGGGIVALLCATRYGTGSPKVLSAGLLAGGLCMLGYVIGIWAATAPDSDEKAEPEESQPESRTSVWLRRAILASLLLIALGAIAWPSLHRIMEGQRTLFDGCIEIVGNLLTLVCVVVPIRIAERRR